MTKWTFTGRQATLCGRPGPKRTFELLMTTVLVMFSICVPVSPQKSKGGTGSQYELVTLGFPQTYAIAKANDLNAQHQVIGTLNYQRNDERAAMWQFAEQSAQPVILPCPAEPCRSRANGINSIGTVVGFAGGLAAKWSISSSGWELSAFPHPGDESYFAEANDVLDNGSAAGMYSHLDLMENSWSTPVLWDPGGNVTELPIPQGYFAGEATRLNNWGDAVGTLRAFYNGSICCLIYGVAWINTPDGYLAFVFNEQLTGITSRGSDGSFYMSSQTGRIKATSPGGSWEFANEANPGPAFGINEEGDIVGYISKGSNLGGQPYLLFSSGAIVKLPVSRGSTGAGTAISSDRWAAGMLDKKPVVWRPAN